MSGENTLYHIFDERSVSQESAPFRLLPGHVAEIMAFGFTSQPFRRDPDEAFMQQEACIHRVYYTETELPEYCPCTGLSLPKIADYRGKILIEGHISNKGCFWSLNYCNNLVLIDIPGVYRLILNDPNAPGNVHIYLRSYSKSELPRNSALFIGE
jgi:hypothetical protein